jgi:hypothetical protein
MLLGNTPPTCPPSLSYTEVPVIWPPVSVHPYASIIGALNTTDKNYFISISNGAPPEMNSLIFPPNKDFIC